MQQDYFGATATELRAHLALGSSNSAATSIALALRDGSVQQDFFDATAAELHAQLSLGNSNCSVATGGIVITPPRDGSTQQTVAELRARLALGGNSINSAAATAATPGFNLPPPPRFRSPFSPSPGGGLEDGDGPVKRTRSLQKFGSLRLLLSLSPSSLLAPSTTSQLEGPPNPAGGKPGRPRKSKSPPAAAAAAGSVPEVTAGFGAASPKPRGRPPKKVAGSIVPVVPALATSATVVSQVAPMPESLAAAEPPLTSGTMQQQPLVPPAEPPIPTSGASHQQPSPAPSSDRADPADLSAVLADAPQPLVPPPSLAPVIVQKRPRGRPRKIVAAAAAVSVATVVDTSTGGAEPAIGEAAAEPVAVGQGSASLPAASPPPSDHAVHPVSPQPVTVERGSTSPPVDAPPPTGPDALPMDTLLLPLPIPCAVGDEGADVSAMGRDNSADASGMGKGSFERGGSDASEPVRGISADASGTEQGSLASDVHSGGRTPGVPEAASTEVEAAATTASDAELAAGHDGVAAAEEEVEAQAEGEVDAVLSPTCPSPPSPSPPSPRIRSLILAIEGLVVQGRLGAQQGQMYTSELSRPDIKSHETQALVTLLQV